MAFLDNPAIASMASAIGLGGLTTNPLVASAAPKVAPAKSAPNQPEYREARFFNPSQGGASRGSGGPGQTPVEPGTMSLETQNSPTVSDLLNHFGVHPLQTVDPNLFIHNAEAWQNHPVMSGILEGLLSGAANTRGGDTIGDSISSVAQGVAATNAQRAERVNSQIMMPYQQAQAVAGLQDQVGKQALQEAQQRHDNAMGSYYEQLPGMKEQIAQDTNDRIEAVNAEKNASKERIAKMTNDAKSAALSAKPVNMDNDTYQKNLNGELAKIKQASGDDNYEFTPADYQKASYAARSAVEDIKTHGRILVKGSQSGGSADNPANRPGYIDPTTAKEYQAADQDLKNFDTMGRTKMFNFGDTSKGEKPVLRAGSAEYNAKRAQLVARRDALLQKAGGAPSKPSYSSNNPFAK